MEFVVHDWSRWVAERPASRTASPAPPARAAFSKPPAAWLVPTSSATGLAPPRPASAAAGRAMPPARFRYATTAHRLRAGGTVAPP